MLGFWCRILEFWLTIGVPFMFPGLVLYRAKWKQETQGRIDFLESRLAIMLDSLQEKSRFKAKMYDWQPNIPWNPEGYISSQKRYLEFWDNIEALKKLEIIHHLLLEF